MNPFQRFVISTVEQFQPKPKNPEYRSVRYSIDSTRVGIQKDFGEIELCSLPQARLDPVVQQSARTIKTMVNQFMGEFSCYREWKERRTYTPFLTRRARKGFKLWRVEMVKFASSGAKLPK